MQDSSVTLGEDEEVCGREQVTIFCFEHPLATFLKMMLLLPLFLICKNQSIYLGSI